MGNTNHDIARRWAAHNSEDPQGKTSNGNFSFNGNVLISYRTPIAQLHQTDSELVALFTNKTYSVTTSGKHQGPGYGAARQAKITSFTVPEFQLNSYDAHILNASHLLGQVDAAIKRIANMSARTIHGEYMWEQPSRAHAELEHYCAVFNIQVPFMNFNHELAKASSAWWEKRAKWTSKEPERLLMGLVNRKTR